MLEHLAANPVTPKRIVILGAGGFVGLSITHHLKGDNLALVALTRKTIDLLNDRAADQLADMLQPEDSLVMVSAIAPCKTNSMLIQNVTMMAAVCAALERSPVAHMIYISSDAVYADSANSLTESSCAEPTTLHGVMHLARELMLKNSFYGPLAILRPTLLYGVADTHNGYGPNRFLRLAGKGKEIVLFGEGEERRDHVLIDDLTEIVRLVVLRRSMGVLNVATGNVVSFRKVAEMIASGFEIPPAIKFIPRQGPMPHKGYRAFDITACRQAFPQFHYTSIAEGLAKTRREMMEK
jgi:UDP-glucose 4-epimerase